MSLFIKRWKNARAVIKQLRAGEWNFHYNPFSGECVTAVRNGRTLWMGNGGFFLDVDGEDVFGLLLRHYVWFAAAMIATSRANAEFRKARNSAIPDLDD